MKRAFVLLAVFLICVFTVKCQEISLPDNPIPKIPTSESKTVSTSPPKPVVQINLPDKVWYKDWKVWAVIATSKIASGLATKEAHDCRVRNGPGPCEGGYGPFKAREFVRLGASFGFDIIGIWGRHMGIKEWALFPVGFAAYNTSVAIRQSRISCPAGEHFLYGTKSTCVENENYNNW